LGMNSFRYLFHLGVNIGKTFFTVVCCDELMP
jgi:hypothetical protein